jgi:murein DD-endopeptidase MepM/ murein hydrolase activator NlpD
VKKIFRKKILIIFLILIFVPVLPISAASQETRNRLRELERELQAAGQRVDEQTNLLAGTEFEMTRIVAEMQELDQEIMDANEALEAIEFDLLTTQLRIDEAEEDLAAAREERDLQNGILRDRVRVMHEQGSVGLLEVLFQAENIADFFLRWEYIRAVAEFDRDLLARLEATEERIAANFDDLTRARVLISDLRTQQERAIHDIERRMNERQIFFTSLQNDAARLAEFIELLEEEARAVNIEFGIVQARHNAEVEEAARIRREEENRRRAEEDARRAAEAAERAAAREVELRELGTFEAFGWPLAIRGTMTSGFGAREDPFTRRTEFHEGIDIAAPAGTHILAAEAGIVRIAGWGVGYGNYIIIDHANGYSTLYAHNSRNRVSANQRVTRGQHIGDVGTTGRSTGNHLHFEIRNSAGTHVNPMNYF